MTANADVRAAEEDCTRVDKILRSGESSEDVTRELTAFAMRGLYGAGIEMLADQTAVELGGGYGDLTQEKARDIFETLDMQAAIYRSCNHFEGHLRNELERRRSRPP
eukprot:m.6166 g.6166  ORF g.6166 m.6166 type:complete len:107 (-) comp3804_c0_seq2:281-601(-)